MTKCSSFSTKQNGQAWIHLPVKSMPSSDGIIVYGVKPWRSKHRLTVFALLPSAVVNMLAKSAHSGVLPMVIGVMYGPTNCRRLQHALVRFAPISKNHAGASPDSKAMRKGRKKAR